MLDETKIRIMSTAKTIAIVGFSSTRFKAGYYVPQYLQEQGYRIIPVNPKLKRDALGETIYPDLASIPQPVDLVYIFRKSEYALPFVRQAIDIGAKAVWLPSRVINETAAAEAQEAGIDFVQNSCMMVEHRRWRQQN